MSRAPRNLDAVMPMPLSARWAAAPWAIHPAHLRALCDQLATATAGAPRAQDAGGGMQGARDILRVEGRTAVIPIHGILLDEPLPAWLRELLGMASTAYGEISAAARTAAADDAIDSIRLEVKSGGGIAWGVKAAADTLWQTAGKKPMTAVVEDLAASAAYWLASQAGRIEAGRDAEIGSIGVYTVWRDSSRAYANIGVRTILIASGPDKGRPAPGVPIEDRDVAVEQAIIDGLADGFVADVARGRRRDEATVRQWATGGTWLGRAAAEMGLIDAVGGEGDGTRRTRGGATRAAPGPGGAAAPSGETTMSDNEAQKQEQRIEQSAEEARRAGRDESRRLLADLRAAFPDDGEFVLAEFEAGHSVAEARGAYADILAERLATSQQRVEELSAQVAELTERIEQGRTTPGGKTGGPGGKALEGGPRESGPVDFPGEARKRAAADGIDYREAMRQLIAQNPEAHRAWLAGLKPARQRR